MFAKLTFQTQDGTIHTMDSARRSRGSLEALAQQMVKDKKVHNFDLTAWETKAAAKLDRWGDVTTETPPSEYSAHKCPTCTYF